LAGGTRRERAILKKSSFEWGEKLVKRKRMGQKRPGANVTRAQQTGFRKMKGYQIFTNSRSGDGGAYVRRVGEGN